MDVGADAAEMVVDVIWCNSIEYGRTNSYQTSYHNCSETVSEASEMMIFEKFNEEEYQPQTRQTTAFCGKITGLKNGPKCTLTAFCGKRRQNNRT